MGQEKLNVQSDGQFKPLCRIILALMLWTCSITAHASIHDQEISAHCPQHIRTSICIVSPVPRLLWRSDVLERPCLAGQRRFADPILDAYRRLPPLLQRRMCKLDRIFVERSFWASGYAHPKTNTIGIHQRMFKEQKTLARWATWKERLPFDMGDIDKHVRTGQPIQLPRITIDAPNRSISSVFFIVVHELAHRLDMDQGLSRFPHSQFAKISWRVQNRKIMSAHLPPSWTAPCFYRCDNHKIPLADVRSTYQDLQRGGFVSLYASRHPSEDFAETLTYYVLSRQKDLDLKLHAGNMMLMDLRSLSRSNLVRQKFDYMSQLIEGGT